MRSAACHSRAQQRNCQGAFVNTRPSERNRCLTPRCQTHFRPDVSALWRHSGALAQAADLSRGMLWRAPGSALLLVMGLLRRAVGWLVPPSAPTDQVSVAFADNEPQAEMMSQLLRREGIACNYQDVPSVQNVAGFRVWVTGAWNPTSRREIIVNVSDATQAKQVLSGGGHPHHEHPRRPARRRRLRSQRKG